MILGNLANMFPAYRQMSGALPPLGQRVLRGLSLILALALLLAGMASDPSPAYFDQAARPSVAAGLPTDQPCGPADGSATHHAFCGASLSCPLCATVEAAASAAGDQCTTIVVRTDAVHGAGDPLSPFHPPKLLVIA